MKFQVKITDEAERNYANLILYLEEEFGEKITFDFKQRFLQFSKLLAENPYLFPLYLENNEIRRGVLIKEVSVYFRIKENVVQILTILDNRRKPPIFES